MSGNFDFLQQIDERVWRACSEAERAFPKVRLVLLGSRAALEIMLRRAFRAEKQPPPEGEGVLNRMIERIERIDGVGQEEKKTLTRNARTIQRHGNRAAHQSQIDSGGAADEVLRALHGFARWFGQRYGNGALVPHAAFRTPVSSIDSAEQALELAESIVQRAETLLETGQSAGSEAVEPAGRTSPSVALSQDSTDTKGFGISQAGIAGVTDGARYVLKEKLAEGGMGVTYSAFDALLNCDVVIKRIRPESAQNPRLIERFLREGRSARILGSPAIARVFDVGRDAEGYFIVMEYVPGKTLRQTLAELPTPKRMPEHQALAIAKALLSGLREAHAAKLVHRDVKPENIILSMGVDRLREPGAVKLIDFGLVRLLDEDPDVPPLTMEGASPGTPGYKAPEVARGGKADERSDIYGVAVVLYEMLTGWRTGEPLRDPNACTQIPEWLRAFLSRALDAEPRNRPDTCEEFEDFLNSQHAEHLRQKYEHWMSLLRDCWMHGQDSNEVLRAIPPLEWPLLVEQARDRVPEAVVLCGLRAYRWGEWWAEMKFEKVVALLEGAERIHHELLAAYLLALCSLQGRCKQDVNYVAALNLFTRVAATFPFANYELGLMAELGLGQVRSIGKAAEFYHKAQKAGHQQAQGIHAELEPLANPHDFSMFRRIKSQLLRFLKRGRALRALR